MDTDLGGEATYEVGENQYVGSAQGMMGNVVTRVTVQDGKVAAVEVLEQTETEGIGTLAINELPGKFVGCATAEEIACNSDAAGLSQLFVQLPKKSTRWTAFPARRSPPTR